MKRVDDPTRVAAVAAVLDAVGHQTDGFDEILTLATRLLGSPIGLVSLVDDERQTFVGEIGTGDEKIAGTPLSHSFCRIVVDDASPLVVANAHLDPRVADNPAIVDLGVVAYCGVPIVDHEGHILGSLCAIDREPHEWESEQIEILEVLARGVGARLSLEARHRTLIRSLHDRVIHVPTGSETIRISAAYRAASGSALGGDFYDVVDGDDGSISLVLADVVGHGIEATVAMAQLQAAARTVLTLEPSLRSCAEHLDRAASRLEGVPYAALTLARIDPEESSLEHICCGALPPLLVRDDGSTEFLTAAQTPSVTFPTERRTAETPLQGWAGLVFYTDGLVERRGEDLDAGFARLADHAHLLHGDGPAEALVDALAADGRDDVAVVVLRPRR